MTASLSGGRNALAAVSLTFDHPQQFAAGLCQGHHTGPGLRVIPIADDHDHFLVVGEIVERGLHAMASGTDACEALGRLGCRRLSRLGFGDQIR